MPFVKLDWDEDKRQINIAKRGIDFADLEPLFEGVTVLMVDDRFDYGETHFVTLGLFHGMVMVIVHTETDELIRVISARKATKYEEESYYREIAN